MSTYSKVTARIAVVTIIFAFLGGIGVIPVHRPHDTSQFTIWPIPPHWGHKHVFACLEIGAVWVVLGLVALVLFILAFGGLLERAGWKKPRPNYD